MAYGRVRSIRHTVSVAAPAGVVYGLLADAPRWPVFWPCHVHVERVDFDGGQERLRVWDVEAGRVRSLLARRVLRPRSRSIDFEQRDVLWPTVAAAGAWSVESEGEERSRLTLRRDLPPAPAVGSAPGARRVGAVEAVEAEQSAEAVEADVRARLERVRETAGHWERLDELLLSFEDSVRIEGPAELVYDFLYRIQDWADLVPHVEGSRVREDQPGVQFAVLDVSAFDSGESVGVESVRLCFPHAGRIVYQQTVTPRLIAAHSGEWYLVPDASGVRAVCARRVLLREEAVEPVLGAGATLLDARRQVREWLGRAGTEALGLAKWHAESAVRRLR
jgi:aromatase